MKEAIKRLPIPRLGGRITTKARRWLKRFLLAELIGTITAVVASYISFLSIHNEIVAAYAGSIGETVGFYATIYRHDMLVKNRKLKETNERPSLADYLHIAKDMVFDFGAAEMVDSLLLRPFFMYIFPRWLNNHTAGIVAGKLASDICFYVPVIVIYEIRVLMKKRREERRHSS